MAIQKKKREISVCLPHVKGKYWIEPGQEIGKIKRVLRAEQVGNFCPIFCIYHGKNHLVHSTIGDISDPFRATAKYLDSLFIVV